MQLVKERLLKRDGICGGTWVLKGHWLCRNVAWCFRWGCCPWRPQENGPGARATERSLHIAGCDTATGEAAEAWRSCVCVCVRTHVFELCGWWGEGPVGRGPASFPTPTIQPTSAHTHQKQSFENPISCAHSQVLILIRLLETKSSLHEPH